MCSRCRCSTSILAPLYYYIIYIIYVQFTWDPATIHTMHLAVCSYSFFLSLFFLLFLRRVLFSLRDSLIHYYYDYYYCSDTWRWYSVIGTIGNNWRLLPWKTTAPKSPGQRGLFSLQSLDDPPLPNPRCKPANDC